MDSPAERRAVPRYEVHADAAVMAGEPGREHQKVTVQNISTGGICLQSETIEDVGTVVDLIIHFPDVGRRLELRGIVVWVTRAPPAEMGVRFQDVAYDDRAALREILRAARPID